MPCTGNVSVKIRIVATWSRSYCYLGTVYLKIASRYLDLLNYANFSEGVDFVFGFTNKCFCVALDDLNHIPMEGLGSKPLRIHLESAKNI